MHKEALVAWADAEIMTAAVPDSRVIELSLCGRQTYSWIIWRLREFQEQPDHDLPLNLLFAQAGVALAYAPDRCPDLILGLRLLNEEEYLPSVVRDAIAKLREHLEAQQQGRLSPADLQARLRTFLDGYATYGPLLKGLP